LITINILVPYSEREYIDNMEEFTFQIISYNHDRTRNRCFFNVKTTEEKASFLALKYGKERVWKR
jgi:hypothetical protein